MAQTRRNILCFVPILAIGISGCSMVSDERDLIGVTIVNHTEETLTGDIEITHEGEIIFEYEFDLPAEDEDGYNGYASSDIKLDPISDNNLTAEISIDGAKTETADISDSCPRDDSQFGVAFRIHEEYINISEGCPRL